MASLACTAFQQPESSRTDWVPVRGNNSTVSSCFEAWNLFIPSTFCRLVVHKHKLCRCISTRDITLDFIGQCIFLTRLKMKTKELQRSCGFLDSDISLYNHKSVVGDSSCNIYIFIINSLLQEALHYEMRSLSINFSLNC